MYALAEALQLYNIGHRVIALAQEHLFGSENGRLPV
jgi:hypothetical protein